MNKLENYLNLKTSFMKRIILLIICLQSLLMTPTYSQETSLSAGLSLATYELPAYQNGFTNFQTGDYYQPVIGEQKSVPTFVLNKVRLKKDKVLSLFVNTLYLFGAANSNNTFGSIGLPSPTFNPLVNTMSSPNDYLLLQQHEFQRNKLLPTFIAAPRALQLRF